MTERKIASRIKAVLLSAVMTATLFVSPAAMQLTTVTAASGTVSINKTLTASEEETPERATRFKMSGLGEDATKVTLEFETAYKGNVTVGIGYNLKDDPYWEQAEGIKASAKDGKFSVTYTFPTASLKDINFKAGEMEVAIWYPQEGETFKLVSASSNSTSTPTTPGTTPTTPGTTVTPTSANARSGAWSVTKDADGNTVISSTLTGVVEGSEEEGGMDYLLTRGIDEDTYKADGITYSQDDPKTNTLPINARKFRFSDFGLKDLTNVTFESFNYVIKSEKEIDSFQYGGGINVQSKSKGDTECLKLDPIKVKDLTEADLANLTDEEKEKYCKDGYWYNDQGEEDMETYGAVFEEKLGYKPHEKYEVENAGSYFNIVWDVPKGVQPWVTKNLSDTVGFQFWYADDANPPEEEGYAAVDEVHLISASCTYTTTITIDKNKAPEVINKTVGEKLTPGSDNKEYHYSLPDLELKERDVVYAVKFNVSSSAKLPKFTGGVGISVDEQNKLGNEGWYDPGNITILDPEKGNSFELMWILPEGIINDIYKEGSANVMLGAWYAGEEAPTLTLDSIDFYVYHTKEADLTASPEEVELQVGDTKKVTVNVPGSTIDFPNNGVVDASINEKGVITIEALNSGEATITVTSPEGQEIKVKVSVTGKAVTTTDPNTKPTNTTTTPKTTTDDGKGTTTVDPDSVIDWTKVKYGDVNVDGRVDVADLVELNKILLELMDYKNATAKENADCMYNNKIEQSDSTMLINYLSNQIKFEKLGLNGKKGITLDS